MPKRETSLAEFVRDYLHENGTAYVAEMRREYAAYCEEHDYNAPSYDSVRSTIHTLKRLGLIEVSHRQVGEKPALEPRAYYKLTSGAIGRDWSDPRGQLYGRSS